MAHDVFISYAAVDKTIADAVCATLEASRIRCWIAPRDVPAGQRYAETILAALREARVVALVFSAASNASPQVQREIDRAVASGLPILPLRVEDVLPTASMEYYLAGQHWLDALTPPLQAHLDHLRSAVEVLLEAPGLPEHVAEASSLAALPPPDPRQRLELPPEADAPAAMEPSARRGTCEACGKRQGELFTVWTGELVRSFDGVGSTTASYAVSERSMYLCGRCLRRSGRARGVLAVAVFWTLLFALVLALVIGLIITGEPGVLEDGGLVVVVAFGTGCAVFWLAYALSGRSTRLGQRRVAAVLKKAGYQVDEYWVEPPRVTYAKT